MYAGRIVETGSVVDVLERPIHPYTARPDRLGAEPQQARRAAGADPRHDALAREAAAGLPVLAALPARDRHLPQHDAGRDALCRRRAWRAAIIRSPASRSPRDPHERARSSSSTASRSASSSRSTRPRRSPTCSARGCSDEVVRAVDDVSLAIGEGEVVGLVGESGCGKSTLGRIVAGILDPSDRHRALQGPRQRRRSTGAERRAAQLAVQMIFQDPMASLNPRRRVVEIIGEAPVVHGIVPAAEHGRLCLRDDGPGRARSGRRGGAIRTSSRAASAPASASPGRSRCARRCWSATSRRRRSTSRSRRRC